MESIPVKFHKLAAHALCHLNQLQSNLIIVQLACLMLQIRILIDAIECHNSWMIQFRPLSWAFPASKYILWINDRFVWLNNHNLIKILSSQINRFFKFNATVLIRYNEILDCLKLSQWPLAHFLDTRLAHILSVLFLNRRFTHKIFDNQLAIQWKLIVTHKSLQMRQR